MWLQLSNIQKRMMRHRRTVRDVHCRLVRLPRLGSSLLGDGASPLDSLWPPGKKDNTVTHPRSPVKESQRISAPPTVKIFHVVRSCIIPLYSSKQYKLYFEVRSSHIYRVLCAYGSVWRPQCGLEMPNIVGSRTKRQCTARAVRRSVAFGLLLLMFYDAAVVSHRTWILVLYYSYMSMIREITFLMPFNTTYIHAMHCDSLHIPTYDGCSQ